MNNFLESIIKRDPAAGSKSPARGQRDRRGGGAAAAQQAADAVPAGARGGEHGARALVVRTALFTQRSVQG